MKIAAYIGGLLGLALLLTLVIRSDFAAMLQTMGLAGWTLLLDCLFLPMVANFFAAVYLNAQFPAVPLWGWLVLIAAVLSAINSIGLKATDAVNKLFVVGAELATAPAPRPRATKHPSKAKDHAASEP